MKPFITSLLVCPLLAVALASAQAQAPAKPNDAQIAQIVNVADTIDIKAGQLALSKSTNAQVKAFAQDMVRDHTQVNEQSLALVKKLNVQPQDSGIPGWLTRQADETMKHLQGLNGAAFDRAYAENGVAIIGEVNDAVRNTLIPSASNPELKNLLQQGLKISEGHQQHAEQLVKELRLPRRALTGRKLGPRRAWRRLPRSLWSRRPDTRRAWPRTGRCSSKCASQAAPARRSRGRDCDVAERRFCRAHRHFKGGRVRRRARAGQGRERHGEQAGHLRLHLSLPSEYAGGAGR